MNVAIHSKAPEWMKDYGTVEARCNPNRLGQIGLVHCEPTGEWFMLRENEDDGEEPYVYGPYYDETSARKVYDDAVAEQSETPNWELQAEYDREHGTDNGYDPQILAWQEMHANEMDVD